MISRRVFGGGVLAGLGSLFFPQKLEAKSEEKIYRAIPSSASTLVQVEGTFVRVEQIHEGMQTYYGIRPGFHGSWFFSYFNKDGKLIECYCFPSRQVALDLAATRIRRGT